LVGAGGGPVGSRRSEARAGVGKREANRVVDGAGGNFIVTNQTNKNREARRVGAGPGVGALLVGEKIPDSTGVRVPTGGLRIGAVELVEETVGFIENENVTIAAAGIRIAFDGRVERDGHGAGVGFAAVGLIVDRDERLRGVDDGVGDAHVGAIIFALAEIRMDPDGRADEIDDVGGVGIHGCAGDVCVPEIVAGERNKAAEAGALTGGHLRAT